MVMLRNIMEGKYSFTSPEWADISGNETNLCKINNAHTNNGKNVCFSTYRGSQGSHTQMSSRRSSETNHSERSIKASVLQSDGKST